MTGRSPSFADPNGVDKVPQAGQEGEVGETDQAGDVGEEKVEGQQVQGVTSGDRGTIEAAKEQDSMKEEAKVANEDDQEVEEEVEEERKSATG